MTPSGPRASAWLTWLPWLLTAATIAAQVGYPLVHGHARDRLTVAIVVLFAAASLSSAARSRGPRFALMLLGLTAVPGLAAELVGVHTGVPFGHYSYATTLGPRLWGVPPVVALAWTMFAWPAAVVAHRLARGFPARVAVGAWALASWDLFLDPQMVAAGQWRWRFPDPHLPGVPAVPLTNYAGWLVTATVISVAVQGLLRRSAPGPIVAPGVALTLFGWTYLSSILALGVFLNRPGAAGWGALGLGLVAGPAFVQGLRSPRAIPRVACA